MRKLLNEELGRLNPDEFKEAPKTPLILVLDNVRSLNNIGSVFRTADAFRLEAIYLCGFTATPPHREIQKTALGATETVSWEYFSSTIDAIMKLRGMNYWVAAAEQADESTSLELMKWNNKHSWAIILGNEVEGVSQEVVDLVDVVLEIPQIGSKHSLNIAVSAGIIVWDFFKALSLSKSR
jgi:tRNA G18 (ribose-2'-O)-methylase SpoU